MKTYTTKYEDTFVQIARDHNIGYVELRAANPDVDPWMPGANAKMTIPTMYILPDAPRESVVINLPEMRLYYFGKNGQAPTSYPIGIGREGLQTPLGETHVRGKKEGPIWRPTPRMRKEDPKLPVEVLPGPDNPMGTHAMYLAWPEYAIHGTNKPYGIGRRSSSGCIRMYPEDIVRLYPKVAANDKVTVVDQPVKAAWVGDKFYIEAHPTMEQANRMELDGGLPTYEMSENEMRAIMKAAGASAADIDWQGVRKVIRNRNGYPVAVMTRKAVKETYVAKDADKPDVADLDEEVKKESSASDDADAAKAESKSEEKKEAVKAEASGEEKSPSKTEDKAENADHGQADDNKESEDKAADTKPVKNKKNRAEEKSS